MYFTTAAFLWLFYKCFKKWRILLEQSVSAHVPLLVAASAYMVC